MAILPHLPLGSQTPIPASVAFTADGITFDWTPGTLEAGYVGSLVQWSEIRDASTRTTPPELRLLDGRTCFVSAAQADELREALASAGIPHSKRPDVWSLLLERFLDSDWGPETKRREMLRAFDVSGSEARRIQIRFGPRMMKLAGLTWEWVHFGLADLIEAHATFRRRALSQAAYEKFRRQVDEVADRPVSAR